MSATLKGAMLKSEYGTRSRGLSDDSLSTRDSHKVNGHKLVATRVSWKKDRRQGGESLDRSPSE